MDATAPATTPAAEVPASIVQRLKRFFPYIVHVQRYWIVVVVATAIAAATEPVAPALLKPLLDQGFQSRDLNLWTIPAALLLLFTVRGAAGFVADIALAKIANEGMLRLRRALFARMLDIRLDVLRNESASSLANSIVHEVQNAITQLVNALTGVVKDGLGLVALLGYLLYINWALTLIVAFLGPAVAWVMRTASRRLHRLAKSSQAATVELAYAVEENMLANRVVRLHGAQQAQAGRFDKLSVALRRLAMKSAVAQAAITPLMHLVAALALSTVICIALWQSGSGMTVGTFASFVTALLMLIAPVKRLSEATSPITRSLALLERSFDLVEKTPPESGGQHDPGHAAGRIEFRRVAVRYPGASKLALEDFSLDVRAGETVALVGPSGSGKTTLVNLLPRFVDATGGQILLDGEELHDWSLAALRRQVAMVSQEVVMFNDVDRNRVMRALEAANLRDLVASLPQGIDTNVGHNAAALSGGQRQRLAIARALYKDAPVLILDEATSALDNESERLVQEALRRLMTGRTTLIIAHRLSTIEHADRIAVLEEGHLVECGSHAELVGRGGLYARLHALGVAGGIVP
jgi:ATP-binding cassette, subfamily B, bacterial MsbA